MFNTNHGATVDDIRVSWDSLEPLVSDGFISGEVKCCNVHIWNGRVHGMTIRFAAGNAAFVDHDKAFDNHNLLKNDSINVCPRELKV